MLAHEAGHILSDHALYQTALLIMLQLAPLEPHADPGGPADDGDPLGPARVVRGRPSSRPIAPRRSSTATRSSPRERCSCWPAGLPSKQLDVNAFLRQAQDYDEWDSTWDRLSRLITELNLTHSHPVRRVAELMAWVRSGEYDRIVGGSYRRRGEPVDPAAEAGEAFKHYRQRFQQIFEDTGESVGKVADRMTDWLARSGSSPTGSGR